MDRILEGTAAAEQACCSLAPVMGPVIPDHPGVPGPDC